jgi:hypothetical protein
VRPPTRSQLTLVTSGSFHEPSKMLGSFSLGEYKRIAHSRDEGPTWVPSYSSVLWEAIVKINSA